MPQDIIADRYILEEIVGEGSYSTVFKGFDEQEKRQIAIKEMKSENLPMEEAREAQQVFFNEINVLKALSHENLPKVYDFFIYKGRHYMVMEWCRGKNLFDLMEEKREGFLQEKETLLIMRQVCDALIYLQHKTRQVIYKDLKPSNILVDDNGKVKLIDFGTARHYSPEKKKDTIALGTPGYAAPEAYTGTQTNLSADVYSFGATFFHLLTGEEPLQFRFNFPDPRTYNKRLSDEISTLIMECLKNRKERIRDGFLLRKRVYGVELPANDNIHKSQNDLKQPGIIINLENIIKKTSDVDNIAATFLFLIFGMGFVFLFITSHPISLRIILAAFPSFFVLYFIFSIVMSIYSSRRWGDYHLSAHEIQDWSCFFHILQTRNNPPAEKLYNRLNNKTKNILKKVNANSIFHAIYLFPVLFNINDILYDRHFYDEDTFEGTLLPDKAEELILCDVEELEDEDLSLLNRFLLESIFSDCIKKTTKYYSTTKKRDLIMIFFTIIYYIMIILICYYSFFLPFFNYIKDQ